MALSSNRILPIGPDGATPTTDLAPFVALLTA
jgi:hypothetical protein